jgi:hypothetical protein
MRGFFDPNGGVLRLLSDIVVVGGSASGKLFSCSAAESNGELAADSRDPTELSSIGRR